MNKEEMNPGNEIATIDKDSVLATNSALGGSFCSFDTSTLEGKKRLFRATSNPDVTLKSMINKEIHVVDVFAKPVNLTDEKTGEVKDGINVVFFDKEGVSYTATSIGVANATRAMLDVFGHPSTWTGPVTIIPKQISVSNGNMLSFDIQ